MSVSPSMGFWLDAATELYMKLDALSSATATLKLRGVYICVFRWGWRAELTVCRKETGARS